MSSKTGESRATRAVRGLVPAGLPIPPRPHGPCWLPQPSRLRVKPCLQRQGGDNQERGCLRLGYSQAISPCRRTPSCTCSPRRLARGAGGGACSQLSIDGFPSSQEASMRTARSRRGWGRKPQGDGGRAQERRFWNFPSKLSPVSPPTSGTFPTS